MADRSNEALRLNEETVKRRVATLGPDHAATLGAMENLAVSYQRVDRLQDAIRMEEKALRVLMAKVGPDQIQTRVVMGNLLEHYTITRRTNDALALFEERLEHLRTNPGLNHPHTLRTMNLLATAYWGAHRLAESEKLCREALGGHRKNPIGDSISLAELLLTFGDCLLRQGKHAEAEPLLVRANQGLKQRETNLPAPWRVGLLNQAAERIVQLYDDSGESHKAAE